MSKRSAILAVVLSLGLMPAVGGTAWANPRQYYGAWQQHPSKTYYYRSYYYKPSYNYVGYRHHYVIYYPSRPKYYYYYNPYKQTYWGRCPVKYSGNNYYSHLAEKDQKGRLEDIDEKAFPPMGKLPSIPESKDKTPLDLPPDDVPTDDVPKT
jgi:hypothetical protein